MQLCHLPDTCHALFYSSAYTVLHPAMLAGSLPSDLMAQLAPALSRLAVLLALPAERRLPGITWAAARPLASAFFVGPLANGMTQWFATASGSQLVTLVAGAAQLVSKLPADERLPGLPAAADEHSATAASLCACLGVVCKQAAEPLPQRALGSAHRKRLAPALLAAVSNLPGLLQLMAAGLDLPAPPPRSSHLLQVLSAASGPGVSIAVSALSSLTALLQEWMDGDVSCCPSGQPQTVPLMAGLADVLPWARAATAALRCGPALAAIDRRLSQLPSGRPQLSPADVSPAGLLEQLALFVARAVAALSAYTGEAVLPLPPGFPPIASVQETLWSLHSAGCRWVGRRFDRAGAMFACCHAWVCRSVSLLQAMHSKSSWLQARVPSTLPAHANNRNTPSLPCPAHPGSSIGRPPTAGTAWAAARLSCAACCAC